jgi:putative NADPH-quinone reductase
MTSDPRILILYAHPEHQRSRVNRSMAEAAKRLPNVHVQDLYQTYPDFHIDVAQEQTLLAEADLIVFQHPLRWYSMPSLLKEWLDEVLQRGWAYGHEGNALRGKDFWLATTTGGPEQAYSASGYHRRPFSDFLAPYEQTAFLCGLRWNEPLVFHDARQADETAIEAHVARYVQRLAAYPTWDDAARGNVPAAVGDDVYIHDPDAR